MAKIGQNGKYCSKDRETTSVIFMISKVRNKIFCRIDFLIIAYKKLSLEFIYFI